MGDMSVYVLRNTTAGRDSEVEAHTQGARTRLRFRYPNNGRASSEIRALGNDVTTFRPAPPW